MKQTIVFIHGFATGPNIWREQINVFQNDYFATTDINCLEIAESAFLVGWSMGGWKALDLYLENPQKIKGLILVSAFAKYTKSNDYPQGTSPSLLKKLEKKIRADYQKGIHYFYSLIFPNKTMHHLINRLPKPQQSDIARWFERLENEDRRSDLNKIKIPTLIIHGGQDPIVSSASAHYLHKNISNSKLYILPQSGHAPFITQAEKFNRTLKEFIKAC